MERRYFAWPAAEDNSVLKLARQRLLGKFKRAHFENGGAQQGLMQIVRDFCEHSNAICEDCRFPELVRGLDYRFLRPSRYSDFQLCERVVEAARPCGSLATGIFSFAGAGGADGFGRA